MARLFDDATPDFLETDTASVTDVPVTMGCWAYLDADVRVCLMGLFDKDVTNQQLRIEIRGDEASNVVQAVSVNAGGTASAKEVGGGVTLNTFTHVLGVFAADNDRRIYRDGVQEDTSSSTVDVINLDRTSIGHTGDSTPAIPMSGRIAEAAMWNVALTTPQIVQLANGVSPLLVAPENLVSYWPLIGRHSPEIDIVGGVDLTITTAVVAEHTRMLYPAIRGVIASVAAAVGAANSILPWLRRRRR